MMIYNFYEIDDMQDSVLMIYTALPWFMREFEFIRNNAKNIFFVVLTHEKRQVSTETCRFSMISVPCGTGDRSSVWYRTSCDNICLRHMEERILYHTCRASISYGVCRISYRQLRYIIEIHRILRYNDLKGGDIHWFMRSFFTSTRMLFTVTN